MNPLERRYRRLLRAYPASYRAQRGDEIVALLLDCARPGQRWPAVADAADVVKHGLRIRSGIGSQSDFDAAVRIAAPIALAIAVGISAFTWWHAEPQIPTTGPVAYAAWLLAIAGWAVLPAARVRALIGGAICATLLSVPLAALVPVERPPIWIIMALTALGLLAFAGLTPATSETRLNVIAGAAAVAIGCQLVSPEPGGYYLPMIARVGLVVAVAALAAGGSPRPGWPRARILAVLLIALPAAWLGPISPMAREASLGAPNFGRLAHVLLGTCIVGALLLWFSRTTLRHAPALVLGSAGGFAAAVLGALQLRAWPIHLALTIGVLAALGVLLALSRRTTLGVLLVTAAASYALSLLTGVYGNDWALGPWADPQRVLTLVSTLAIVPATIAVIAVARAPRRTAADIGAALIALGWISYLTLPALTAWGPLLWLGAATIAGAVLMRAWAAARSIKPSTRWS